MASLEELIRLACLMEATSRKAGNVHPGESFEHLEFDDFVRSAEAASGWLARAGELGVGTAIFEAVRATRQVCEHNTNLGIVLLIAPLAAVPEGMPPGQGVRRVLAALTASDADAVYQAIRLANPRGLGAAERGDVRTSAPPGGLLEAMRLAANSDSIAAQYANGFDLVLRSGTDRLRQNLLLFQATERFDARWEASIVRLQLELMAHQPDTDIRRKCGADAARESAARAAAVLDAGWPFTGSGRILFREFDAWLRAEGSQRNPGTTADLVTATLFAVLRQGAAPVPGSASITQFAGMIRTGTVNETGLLS